MIKIRDAVAEDLPEILAIYNVAVRTTTATFDLEEQTLADRLTWFQQFGEKYPLIVAEDEKEVLGYCSLSPFHKKAAYKNTCEISIYLSGKHRGAGIGSLLMKEIINRAKKHGFHSIIALITAGNAASVKLHKKFGFQFAGRLKEAGFKFGQWLDVDYYQLILQGCKEISQ